MIGRAVRILQILTHAFPVWILAGAVLALLSPELFSWFTGPWIPLGLGIIMLGMGLTLSPEDFRSMAVLEPRRVLLGVLLQYTVMPLLGWILASIFELPAALGAGLILVACCPGGTASNVVTYLARAHVPLSVTMTAVSTILAVIMTPVLTALLAGARVHVDAWGLFFGTLQVVILPIAAGLALNRYLPRFTERILPAAPLTAVVFITLIVASIVAGGRPLILESGLRLTAAVFSLHALGFLLGYLVSFSLTRDEKTARTISIEVGMQNSGLGAVLARQSFPDPASAIPSAISSVFHSLIGSLLAALWRGAAQAGGGSSPKDNA